MKTEYKLLKNSVFITVAILLLAVASCKRASYLTADVATIQMTRFGGCDSLRLSSDVEGFELEMSPEWVKAEIIDSLLIVSVPENKTQQARSGDIVISAGGKELTIPVNQAFMATRLKAAVDSISFPIEGGREVIDIDCDGRVALRIPDWIRASYKKGKLVVSTPANEEGDKWGLVRLTSDDLVLDIPVSIAGLICSNCNGTGKITCPKCGGRGEAYDETFGSVMRCLGCAAVAPDDGEPWWGPPGPGTIKCPVCRGTGHPVKD